MKQQVKKLLKASINDIDRLTSELLLLHNSFLTKKTKVSWQHPCGCCDTLHDEWTVCTLHATMNLLDIDYTLAENIEAEDHSPFWDRSSFPKIKFSKRRLKNANYNNETNK